MHFFGGTNLPTEICFKKKTQDKYISRASGDSGRQQNEHPPRKFLRCGYVDHLIANCHKLLKDNDKRQKNVRFNESGDRTSEKNPRTVKGR